MPEISESLKGLNSLDEEEKIVVFQSSKGNLKVEAKEDLLVKEISEMQVDDDVA